LAHSDDRVVFQSWSKQKALEEQTALHLEIQAFCKREIFSLAER
jgi:hypothetical protein